MLLLLVVMRCLFVVCCVLCDAYVLLCVVVVDGCSLLSVPCYLFSVAFVMIVGVVVRFFCGLALVVWCCLACMFDYVECGWLVFDVVCDCVGCAVLVGRCLSLFAPVVYYCCVLLCVLMMFCSVLVVVVVCCRALSFCVCLFMCYLLCPCRLLCVVWHVLFVAC